MKSVFGRERCKGTATSTGSSASAGGSAMVGGGANEDSFARACAVSSARSAISLQGPASSTGAGGITAASAATGAAYGPRLRNIHAKVCLAPIPGSTVSRPKVGSARTGRGGRIGRVTTACAATSERLAASLEGSSVWIARGDATGGGSAMDCAVLRDRLRDSHLKDRQTRIQVPGRLPDKTIPPTYRL